MRSTRGYLYWKELRNIWPYSMMIAEINVSSSKTFHLWNKYLKKIVVNFQIFWTLLCPLFKEPSSSHWYQKSGVLENFDWMSIVLRLWIFPSHFTSPSTRAKLTLQDICSELIVLLWCCAVFVMFNTINWLKTYSFIPCWGLTCCWNYTQTEELSLFSLAIKVWRDHDPNTLF